MELNVKANIGRVLQMNKLAIAKFVIPFCLAGVMVLFFLFFVDPQMSAKYAVVFSIHSFLPSVGPILAIPEGLGSDIHPITLIAFIVFTDVVLALFLVWNFDYAKKIPYLGILVVKTEESGERALSKYKWAKRLGFLGVVLLVIIPIQWTGSAVGAIVGRLIGMTPLMTWLAVVLGSFLRSTLITLVFKWLFAVSCG
jgi:uncharacterized membrane protein